MRKSTWTPSIVPHGGDQNVYLVAENFGRLGEGWREADCEGTGLETVIQDLLMGQYRDPIRVVALIPPRAGRRTSPRTLRKNSAGAAICNCRCAIQCAGLRRTT
jgi:hypothetical protein